MKLTLALILPALAVFSGTAMSAITYVDAVSGASGNTFATGGSLAVTTWTTTSSGSTTQWRGRPFAFGTTGNTVFEAIASPPTNIPELTTQITGLTNGTTYDLWAFFVDGNNSQDGWNISAGLTSGSLTTYSNPGDNLAGTVSLGVVNVTSLSFTNTVGVVTGFSMYGVKVGQAVATGGSVNVFIDRNFAGSAADNRVWYDGVGFEAVPEPSAALLGAVGLLALLRRRR